MDKDDYLSKKKMEQDKFMNEKDPIRSMLSSMIASSLGEETFSITQKINKLPHPLKDSAITTIIETLLIFCGKDTDNNLSTLDDVKSFLIKEDKEFNQG